MSVVVVAAEPRSDFCSTAAAPVVECVAATRRMEIIENFIVPVMMSVLIECFLGFVFFRFVC